jgi:hypothetical protein
MIYIKKILNVYLTFDRFLKYGFRGRGDFPLHPLPLNTPLYATWKHERDLCCKNNFLR